MKLMTYIGITRTEGFCNSDDGTMDASIVRVQRVVQLFTWDYEALFEHGTDNHLDKIPI